MDFSIQSRWLSSNLDSCRMAFEDPLNNQDILDREKKEVTLLFIGMLVLSSIETLGVASIVPFMAMVSDNSVVLSNEYLNKLYLYFEFNNVESFLFATGITVLIFMAISNLLVSISFFEIQNNGF